MTKTEVAMTTGNGVVGGDGLVGLVLVSHSAAIADGLAEFVAQVAGPDVAIVAAGGGPDGTLGTDGGKVLAGLRGVANGAGAVVLMDLGSSVLSVRAALEELAPAECERIAVVDAPFVEGAIAAGVTASTGASRDEVAAAAEEARGAPKL
jgi:phosphoenolpyruvate---glycerone phosphotransferase subunit DhaM